MISTNPIGAHVSIKNGYTGAFTEALGLGATALQLFAKSPMSGKLREVTDVESKEVAELLERKKIAYAVIHASYLLNFAKKLPTGSYQEKSLTEDLRSADKLGASGVVLHMGKALDIQREGAIELFVNNISHVLTETKGLKSKIILENTAGQGSELGFRFDEFGKIFKAIKKSAGKDSKRLAVCLDTAHAFGAGYNLSDKIGIDNSLLELDKKIGISEIDCVHFNDSKKQVGSRVDRHQDIGYGEIGNTGLKYFVSKINSLSRNPLPLILETPTEHATYEKQLEKMRGWLTS